jgi:hypothetical protein
MGKNRAKDMKNWAAIRRKRRRASASASPEATQAARTTIYMENVVAEDNGGAGVRIGPGVEVRAKGLTTRRNKGPGVDNAGRFDGPDTEFG